MNRLGHKLQILTTLYYSNAKLTATDFSYISNPNQYFVELELQGLIKSEWAKLGKAKVKLRYVPNESKAKVMKYLEIHTKFNEAKNGKY